MGAEFDNLAQEVEVALRQLRRLVADTVVLTDQQTVRLAALATRLQETAAAIDETRGVLLGRSGALEIDPAARLLVTGLAERLSLERQAERENVTVDDLFAEKPEDEIDAKSLGKPEPIEEEYLPVDADLHVIFPPRSCFPDAPGRLFFAVDAEDRPVLVNDERGFESELPSDQQVLVLTFASDADRQAYFDRVWDAAQDERDGGAIAPIKPSRTPPERPGGAQRTIDEALEPPRNP